jgi:hypothetical protein
VFREIKADPKLPYHYIIAVAIKTPVGGFENAGEFYIKYGPFCFTHEDIVNFRDGIALTEDPLYTNQYKMTKRECLEVTNSTKFSDLWALRMGASVNNCTMHHFCSSFEIPAEYFDDLVKTAKISQETRKLLNDSRMHN